MIGVVKNSSGFSEPSGLINSINFKVDVGSTFRCRISDVLVPNWAIPFFIHTGVWKGNSLKVYQKHFQRESGTKIIFPRGSKQVFQRGSYQ